MWCETRIEADGRLRATTLCRYARVYCLHVLQLQVASMGLRERERREVMRKWACVCDLRRPTSLLSCGQGSSKEPVFPRASTPRLRASSPA